MTVGDFLAWEERRDLRYELEGFQAVAMGGGPYAHDLIAFNLRKALDSRLAGKPCTPCGPNLKILAAGTARDSGPILTCTPGGPAAAIVGNPGVLLEVVGGDDAQPRRTRKLRQAQLPPPTP